MLSHDDGAVDLSRIVGAHVLDSHDNKSVRSVIGIVLSARIENGNGIATLRLDDNADIIRKVKDGILRHVSVGYSVSKWSEGSEGGTKVRTAARWQPMEISIRRAFQRTRPQ